MKRLLGVLLLFALGCGRAVTPPLEISQKAELPKIRTLAVVPASAAPAARGDAVARAPEALTAMLDAAAARQAGWALAEPEKVRAALPPADVADLEERAGSVAAKIGADAALTAVVLAYGERKGSDYGASDGATVSLKVLLVLAAKKQASWSASYAIHQVPLTYNLWNLWGVLRGGPRWLTADELAHIGVDEAVTRLAKSVP